MQATAQAIPPPPQQLRVDVLEGSVAVVLEQLVLIPPVSLCSSQAQIRTLHRAQPRSNLDLMYHTLPTVRPP